MMSVSITTKPSITVLQHNIRMQRVIMQDLSEFFRKKAQPIVKKTFQEIFALEGAYEGNPRWADLNRKYAKYKTKKVGSKTILMFNDKYWKALCRSGASGNIFIVGNDKMEWGVDEGYFSALTGNPNYNYPSIHEYGMGNIPKRPVISLAQNSIKMSKEITTALDKYIASKLRLYWKIKGMRGMV